MLFSPLPPGHQHVVGLLTSRHIIFISKEKENMALFVLYNRVHSLCPHLCQREIVPRLESCGQHGAVQREHSGGAISGEFGDSGRRRVRWPTRKEGVRVPPRPDPHWVVLAQQDV